MSPLDSNPRELIAFAGAVQCEVAAGAVDLVLRGYERARPPARSEVAELLFSGAGAVALPPELHDARVIELTRAPAPRRYRIESPQLQLELSARSAQLHRDVAAAFFAAVPPARVPLRQRLGWSLLLTLLRLPRAELLVRKLRGST